AAGRAGLVPQRGQHLLSLEPGAIAEALNLLHRDLPVRLLNRPEYSGQTVERLMAWTVLQNLLEETDERLLRPFRRQPEQAQEIEHLDRMDLHRRGGQQDESLGSIL